jgi:spore coat protein U-like protein
MIRRLMLCTLLPLFFCVMCSLRAQAAPNCAATADKSLSFGSIDILNYTSVDATAQLTVSCTGLSSTDTARVCLSFTGGSVNTPTFRQMRNGTKSLNYRLAVAGSSGYIGNTSNPSTVYIDLTSARPNTVVYMTGFLGPGQTSRPVGYYVENMQINSFYATYADIAPTDCDIPQTGLSSISLLVDATIAPNCSIKATALVFPTLITFVSDVAGQSTLTVTCTTDAPYWVSLDNGQNALSGQRRMRSGANYIEYDLYRDSGSSLRWGFAKDVDTVSGAGVYTGTQLPVYGKIPKPAAAPPPGVYADQIIATVNF